MKLGEYLKSCEIKPSAFAKRLGVNPSTITRLVRGERTPSLALAVKIERETNGAVPLQDQHGAPAAADQPGKAA